MEKFIVYYEKGDVKDSIVLYADSKEEAESQIRESFEPSGYKVTGAEALGIHLTREQVYSK